MVNPSVAKHVYTMSELCQWYQRMFTSQFNNIYTARIWNNTQLNLLIFLYKFGHFSKRYWRKPNWVFFVETLSRNWLTNGRGFIWCRTLIHGDKKAGFTIFWADDGLDTGPILLQKSCVVEPDDTVETLYNRFLYPEGIKALVSSSLCFSQSISRTTKSVTVTQSGNSYSTTSVYSFYLIIYLICSSSCLKICLGSRQGAAHSPSAFALFLVLLYHK